MINHRAVFSCLLAPLIVFMLGTSVTAYADNSVDVPDCQGAEIILSDSLDKRFILPRDAAQLLKLAPDEILTISALNIPDGTSVRVSINGFGSDLASYSFPISSGESTVNVSDVAMYARGIYSATGVLTGPDGDLCATSFDVQITGFGGVTAYASTAVAIVASLGTVASIALASSGLAGNVNAEAGVARRRSTGWRRWVPVPSWKRSIVSSVIGSFTGVMLLVVLQQAGLRSLDLVSIVVGLLTGGGISFGIGYCIGAIITFIRKPVASR